MTGRGRLLAARAGSSQVLLLGHRGARRYAPENTFTSFDLALQHGCDGFEFDVRRTADGRAVICHDEHYGRRRVDASNYGDLAGGRELPCLEDVVRRYGATAFLYIELKVSGLEEETARMLRECAPARGYVVASFLPDVLERMKAVDPAIPLGLIAGNRRGLERWRELPVGYIMPQCELVSAELVETLHAAGKRVFVWTVNSERPMRNIASLGVEGILSDDTELLCRTLGRRTV